MKKGCLFLSLVMATVLFASCGNTEEGGISMIEISNPIASTAKNTFTNPVVWADVPDVDVIRVDDVYYMSSTTMHLSPGCPIMKSYDLVNWETVNYVYDTLDDSDAFTLQNGAYAYGKGSWASSLRYNNGVYYCTFMSYTTGKTYIYQTTDIENGKWEKSELNATYHDMSLLFDDDGRVYMVYGGVPLSIIELEIKDGYAGIKQGGLNKVLIEDASMGKDRAMTEGAHIYKKDGYYYIFMITWPKGDRRTELCYRSTTIDGEYEGQVVLSDNMGYYNAGVAQGGIVETADGVWYAMLFQDHGAVGRTPVLVPMTWEDNWPVLGVEGVVPVEMEMPVLGHVKKSVVSSDEFDKQTLGLDWQWNHNPDHKFWSLTEREGFMRLTTGSVVTTLSEARNTLTQRTFGPVCSGTVALEVGNMIDGDVAGIAAFAEKYGYIAVKMQDGVKSIVIAMIENKEEKELATVPLEQDKIYFKIDFDFNLGADKAEFLYSYDGVNWTKLGAKLSMDYYGLHFMGYRFAMFNYATQSTGGYVDFDYYQVDNKLTK